MHILKQRTLQYLVYTIIEQGIRSYFHWRSARKLGREQQKHEMRKDGISLARNCAKAVAQAAIYNLDSI